MTIGRNDPCSCGSGKKYKKCCMAKNQPKSSSQLLSNVKVINSAGSMLSRISPMAPKAQPDIPSVDLQPEKKKEEDKGKN